MTQAWAQSRGPPSRLYTSHSLRSAERRGERVPGRGPAAHPPASPPARLTLAEAVGGRAAHVEAGLAAAVLGPVDLGAAGLAAERRVVRDAPGGGSWGGHTHTHTTGWGLK